MSVDDEWSERAKRLLRAEMVKRGVTYEQLSESLALMGIQDTPVNLRNKVSRGKFMASFLLECLHAMGVEVMRLSDT